MMMLYVFTCLIYLAFHPSVDAVIPDIYWREYVPGDIPSDAYEGAPDRYIGQILVSHEGSYYNLPATIYPDTNMAVGELYGKKTVTENIKILCSSDKSKLYWEDVDMNKPQDAQLKYAVKGGYERFNEGIGKAMHEGEWRISKVNPFDMGATRGLHLWNNKGTAAQRLQFSALKFNVSESCLEHCHNEL